MLTAKEAYKNTDFSTIKALLSIIEEKILEKMKKGQFKLNFPVPKSLSAEQERIVIRKLRSFSYEVHGTRNGKIEIEWVNGNIQKLKVTEQ